MDSEKVSKRWGWNLRIVHWLDALVVLGLLATVILRKTFLSYKTNGALIQEKLAALNLEITIDAAKGIGRAIRAPMWAWHYYLGFALAALLVYRIFLMVAMGEREIISTSLLSRKSTVGTWKRLARSLHVVYYVFILVMVATGLVLYFHESFGLTRESAGGIKEWHETLTLFFFIFVPLHIIGVMVAENLREPGIVSAMINGGRTSPPPSAG